MLVIVVRDKSVGGDGAAVLEKRGVAKQLRGTDAGYARRFVDCVHDAAGKIVRRGGGLGRPDLAGVTQYDDVSKRSAGIYADNVLRLRCHAVSPFCVPHDDNVMRLVFTQDSQVVKAVCAVKQVDERYS